MRARVLTIASVLVAAMLALAGCAAAPAPDTSPRPVTSQEAELLALLRFNNFNAGARSFSASFDDRGHAVTLDGRIDFTTHTGYALLTVDEGDARLVLWNGDVVAVAPSDGTPVGELPLTLDGWSATELDPEAAPLHALLTVLISLGADRPENPVLVEQGGALHLRDDTVGITPVSVFAGPSKNAVIADTVDPDAASVRYWIDKDGLLHRAEVRLGGSWTTVDFGETAAPVPPILDGVSPGEPAP